MCLYLANISITLGHNTLVKDIHAAVSLYPQSHFQSIRELLQVPVIDLACLPEFNWKGSWGKPPFDMYFDAYTRGIWWLQFRVLRVCLLSWHSCKCSYCSR